MSNTPTVTIAKGAIVVYFDAKGEHAAASVDRVDEERELVHCRNVPGVLRLEDIYAVGVYGDEARYELDEDGTGGDRIQWGDDDGE